MTRSILVGEVRTGRRITQIPASAASWSMVHRGGGEIRATIPLGATDFRNLERQFVGGLYPGAGVFPSPETYPADAAPVWRPGNGLRPELLAAVEPARCFLAVVEGDEVLEAGPIWAWEYDDATAALTVIARDLWSLFDHRFVVGDLTAAWEAWAATYSGLSLGTVAKRLVQLTEATAGGNLPIVLPEDEAAGNERTYRGYDLATVRQRLEELMGVEGGPDIAFVPRLTADRLGIEWVMRVGTAADPLLAQSSLDHVWDTRVPRGGVAGLSVKRDASGLASRSYATGAGMETALLMSMARSDTLTGAGFPLLETKESRSTVERRATLDQWARANLSRASRPWMTWDLTVSTDASPRLGEYRPGDFAKVWVREDHPLLGLLLPRGFHRARILSVSGDMGSTARVSLAPAMEVR